MSGTAPSFWFVLAGVAVALFRAIMLPPKGEWRRLMHEKIGTSVQTRGEAFAIAFVLVLLLLIVRYARFDDLAYNVVVGVVAAILASVIFSLAQPLRAPE